jgi:hypothetical protein
LIKSGNVPEGFIIMDPPAYIIMDPPAPQHGLVTTTDLMNKMEEGWGEREKTPSGLTNVTGPSRYQLQEAPLCTLSQCFGPGSSDPYMWLQMRLWILLFSSVTFKMPTKIIFFNVFAYYFFNEHLHHSSQIKAIKKSKNSRNRVFYYSILAW